jgi:hypothetical protein
MDDCIYIGIQEGRVCAVFDSVAPDKDALANYFLALATEGGFTSPDEESQGRAMANAMAIRLLARSQEAIQEAIKEHKADLRHSLGYSPFSDDA